MRRSQKKGPRRQLFRWTSFRFDCSRHSLWHPFGEVSAVSQGLCPSCVALSFHLDLEIDEGRITYKAFSSTPQRLTMGLKSGLWRGQSRCENDISCPLNHSITIWPHWILVLSSWNIAMLFGKETNPLME